MVAGGTLGEDELKKLGIVKVETLDEIMRELRGYHDYAERAQAVIDAA